MSAFSNHGQRLSRTHFGWMPAYVKHFNIGTAARKLESGVRNSGIAF